MFIWTFHAKEDYRIKRTFYPITYPMGGVRPSPLSRTLLGLISSSAPLILLCRMLSTPINMSKLKIKHTERNQIEAG